MFVGDKGLGHESLTRLLLLTKRLSVRYPDSATSTRYAHLVYRLRPSSPLSPHKQKDANATHPCLMFVGDKGLEPPTSTMSM